MEGRPMKTQPLPVIRSPRWMIDLVNPVVLRVGLFPALTVLGRRTGTPHTVPIGGPFEFEGARYLVSGRGNTSWARNLRAAGRGELRMHGRVEPFRAVEVIGLQRDRVMAAYRTALGRSVTGFFARIPDPADHPVFRIEAAEAGASAA
jgi:deazaflavin-dependent oxidoreductase (nitroreductase family)